ncbi:hypothetical protein ARMSODRAFT_1005160 [Armillaria solidipes]|uniref:Uncharacterized protein n=1 Tax=Armillaria solidipes TaxID=1076256 RepID=A0A2H3BA08_9AGAR|nr:hypothetical protein ARMSODRAFT_1005160 [Armillaria solidipes]
MDITKDRGPQGMQLVRIYINAFLRGSEASKPQDSGTVHLQFRFTINDWVNSRAGRLQEEGASLMWSENKTSAQDIRVTFKIDRMNGGVRKQAMPTIWCSSTISECMGSHDKVIDRVYEFELKPPGNSAFSEKTSPVSLYLDTLIFKGHNAEEVQENTA